MIAVEIDEKPEMASKLMLKRKGLDDKTIIELQHLAEKLKLNFDDMIDQIIGR